MGQMMALSQTELIKIAAQSNYPEYGISGKLNYVTEKGVRKIGVSGNKANHLDLTVELGFSSDLGVTNDRYPEEVCEGQSQSPHGLQGIQISTKDMEYVDFYLHALGVPARRYVNNAEVKKGEENFYKAKCDLCHMPLYTPVQSCLYYLTVLDSLALAIRLYTHIQIIFYTIWGPN